MKIRKVERRVQASAHLVVGADCGGGGHGVDNLPADILVDGEAGVHGHGHHAVKINTSITCVDTHYSDAQGKMRNDEKMVTIIQCCV